MREDIATFRAIPKSEIDPQIAAVLEPGEQVYWQARPEKKSIIKPLFYILIVGGLLAWLGDVREYAESLKAFWQQLPWVFLLFSLLPVALIIAFWPRQMRYALTDRRVFRLRSGKIRGQANQEQLMIHENMTIRIPIGKRSNVGDVEWANADTFDRDRRRYVKFEGVSDADGVRQMLKDWMGLEQDARDREAAASSESFRQAVDESGAAAGHAPDTGATETARDSGGGAFERIVHPQHGFSIDVPSAWDIEVEQNHDGPLRIFGITLLNRIIRPGTPQPWDPRDDRPWNKMMLRAGATVKLDISITPSAGEAMPSEEEVLNDRLGKLFGVSVRSFERDLDIHGFRGFTAVRELAAGYELPVATIMRDWWLSGHGLVFEIQGAAPQDSTTLQETLDLVVNSLRPGL